MGWKNDMTVKVAAATFKNLLRQDITKGNLFISEKVYLRELPPVLEQAAQLAEHITSKPGQPIPDRLAENFRLSMKIFRVMGEDAKVIRLIADKAAEFARVRNLPADDRERLARLLQKLENGFSTQHQFERAEHLPGMGLR